MGLKWPIRGFQIIQVPEKTRWACRSIPHGSRQLSVKWLAYGLIAGERNSFYSDGAMAIADVIQHTGDFMAKMRSCGHPQILGSEWDVLFVPGTRLQP